MFTKTLLIAALAIVSAGTALAAEVTPDVSRTASKLTRAEVIAEYVRARQAGELKYLTGFETTLDAQPIRAPRMPMAEAGAKPAMSGTDAMDGTHRSGSVHDAAPLSLGKTRAQVVAETREALRLGVADLGESSAAPTLAQLESIRLAGLKAIAMEVATR